MLLSHGNYAIIAGLREETSLVRSVIHELNQPLVVYGDPPGWLQRPYLLEDHTTAKVRLNTTVVSFGRRLSTNVLKNPMVGGVYVMEYPWVLIDPEEYHQIFVSPGVLPLEKRGTVYSALFRRSMTYNEFVRLCHKFPTGILAVSGHGGTVKHVSVPVKKTP